MGLDDCYFSQLQAYNFIRVHENLAQSPNNNILIVIYQIKYEKCLPVGWTDEWMDRKWTLSLPIQWSINHFIYSTAFSFFFTLFLIFPSNWLASS